METGSQIARSIISNIFRKIDSNSDREEARSPVADETEEIEILSKHLDRVEEEDRTQPGSSDLDSVVQSPKTVERISNWINDLQSNVSLDGYTSYSSPLTIKSGASASQIKSVGSQVIDKFFI